MDSGDQCVMIYLDQTMQTWHVENSTTLRELSATLIVHFLSVEVALSFMNCIWRISILLVVCQIIIPALAVLHKIACTYSLAGPIWLDNLDCSAADRFEDCTHPGWGVHNCGHSEDVGLICNPGSKGRIYVSIYLVYTVYI